MPAAAGRRVRLGDSEVGSHVQVGAARKAGFAFSPSRAGLGLTVVLVMFGLHGNAKALGENRSISLHNIHTHEDLTITYKKNGRFDDAALKKLNAFLRDWRKEEEVRMDPQLFDMLWEVHREVKASGPIHVVCGYRSPATNAMLRSRSGGVARTSLHMQGKAIDFSIPSAEVADVRAAALRIQGGGVGYYPTSGLPFVHMDVGSVRHWPRMTREQLVKVFPSGRTVHVPADGNPLPGYELALADVERGVAHRPAERPQRSLLASLFGNNAPDAEEVSDAATARQTAATLRRPAPAAAPTPAPAAVATAAPEDSRPIPLPPVRPIYQVASATETRVPAPAPRPSSLTTLASLNANQVISARGYWQGLPDAPPELAALSISGSRRGVTLQQTASADPDMTASLGPAADRVPSDLALAYAAQAESTSTIERDSNLLRAAAVVTRRGAASVALKPAAATSGSGVRPVTGERLDDPWLRGVVIAPSVQTSMTMTTFGAPDFRNLRPFMQKPATSVMMTFSGDPHLGMTTETFSGSAVVFQATVTYGMRTAALN